MSDSKKRKKKQTIIIVVLGLLLAGCIAVIAVLLTGHDEKQPAAKSAARGAVGVISDDWDTEVSQPEESGKQQKSGIQIPGYSSAEMQEGDMSLKIRIGNPKENEKAAFYATLKLEDGTVLYESPLLKPGQGLDEVPLTQTLKKGEYQAMVYYRCVLLEDGKTPLNSAESGFTLYVD